MVLTLFFVFERTGDQQTIQQGAGREGRKEGEGAQ